ncbi:hypothetical protein M0Q50_09070 [bacterium]|jgi:hypothetical protein|nr:hypothetical protein [bacterium]
MIRDIYIRNPEDPNFKYGILEHNDVIESIITKIKMILGTRSGQVFGDIAFGVGIEDYIFETKINKVQLEEKIKMQFDRYISECKDYQINPEISFGKADGYDYAIIDIFIDNTKIIGLLVK